MEEDKKVPTKIRLFPSCLSPLVTLKFNEVRISVVGAVSVLGPGDKEEIRNCSFVYLSCDLSSSMHNAWLEKFTCQS